jgi:hypothetical protein
MSWRTIRKYLDAPAQGPAQRQRESKLDPFKATIAEWLEKDPTLAAVARADQACQDEGRPWTCQRSWFESPKPEP